jgi:hypothetical protein
VLDSVDSNIAEAHTSLAHVLTIDDFDWAVASHAAAETQQDSCPAAESACYCASCR